MDKNFCRLLIVFLSTFASSVLSLDDSARRTAQEQADGLWTLIEQSRYDTPPPFAEPSASDSFTVLRPDFNNQVFVGDHVIMPEGRKKIIHPMGVVARVRYVVTKRSYSGILASGAPLGLLRLSLARAPGAESYLPGFGLMLFIDHNPPVTMLAMPSLDPQTMPNLFELDYVTAIPEPKWTFSGWLLSSAFAKGIYALGFTNHNPRALVTDDFVKIHADGTVAVNKAQAPHSLIFSPTQDAKNLLRGIRSTDDFRSILAANGQGRTIFQVFARMNENSDPELIGEIQLTSNWEASDFADNKLRFKHPAPKENPPQKRNGCFRWR